MVNILQRLMKKLKPNKYDINTRDYVMVDPLRDDYMIQSRMKLITRIT